MESSVIPSSRRDRPEPVVPFRNEAGWDRGARVALGVAMVAVGFWGPIGEVAAAALKVFALVPLVTGLLGWCPFYSLLGFGTRRP